MKIKRKWGYLILITIHSALFTIIYSNIINTYNSLQVRADKLVWLYLISFLVSVVISFQYVFYSYRKFTATQLLCFWFLPYLTLIYYAIIKGEYEDLDEKEKKSKVKSLNNTQDSLYKLRERKILSEEEYRKKLEQVQKEKTTLNIEQSEDYIELKNLFQNGILTEQEFNDKIEVIKSKL